MHYFAHRKEKLKYMNCHVFFQNNNNHKNSCFSDFVLKIRLIRIGFSFQKTKIAVF